MFRSFLFDHLQGAICRALCCYYNVFRYFAFVEYLLGMWPYVCITYLCVCVCLVLLSVEDLFVNCSQTDLPLTRAPSTQTNRWYTHTATYQVNTQRTQNSGRHYSNGTKHDIWPPEDCRIKRTETCRTFLCLQTCFQHFSVLNVKVSVF